MKNFIKHMMNKFSILTLALISAGLMMTACTASERSTNDKAASGTETQKVENKTDSQNKSVESKSVESEQAKLLEIYDWRQEVKNPKLNVDEAETVEDAVRAKAAEIKKINKDSCEGEDKFSTSGVAGSFTKPNSKQTAYLYALCDDGDTTSPGVVGGIVIVEDGKSVAIFTLKYYGSMDIISLPDINKNGLSEIGLLQSDGGQGQQSTTLSVYEYNKAKEIATLGGTEVSVTGFDSNQSNEKAYKISVEPSANPIFYCEIYVKKDGAKDWSLSKKAEKFSLDPKDAPQPTLNEVN